MEYPLAEIVWGLVVFLIACSLPGGWGHSRRSYYHPPRKDVIRWGGRKT